MSNTATVLIDDVPLSRFHLRVTAFTTGGMFCDGYILGIIGIALAVYGPQVGLSALWAGIIGAAALVGLFLGSLLFGPVIDRVGRQTMYVVDLCVFVVGSLLHLVAEEPWEMASVRFLLGLAMGVDYAIGATLLSEFLPRKHRGPLLASLNAVWTVGFVAAFVFGYLVRGMSDDSWRWMLASSAVPAVIVLCLRLGAPESPRWLAARGRTAKARRVLDQYFGTNVVLGGDASTQAARSFASLFSREWRTRTAFASLFWFCQVLPYFALFTFAPSVLDHLGLNDEFTGTLVLNVFQLVGAVAGVIVMNRLPRRGFTIWSFVGMAIALLPFAVAPSVPVVVVVGCFCLYALLISSAGNLCQVYPAELFPTDMRATGVGFASAMSRVGAAIGTFLLPVSLNQLGTQLTMAFAVLVLVIGVVVSVLWAPETRHLTLGEASLLPDADHVGRVDSPELAKKI